MASEKPLVYLLLGTPGSGRRELLVDLINGTLSDDDSALVLLSAGETSTPVEDDLPEVQRWTMNGDAIEAVFPHGATHVFFIADGRRDPVEQVEAFKNWLVLNSAECARILTVVNCQLAEKHPALLPWFEACIHFSDVVLLNRREGVANKWMSDFTGHFKKLFYPCLFELVKDDRVKNPALILEPQARRMSHAFDQELEWLIVDDEEEGGEGAEGDEEIEVKLEEEPYFQRNAGGRRIKILPEITKYLE